jgi:chloride channel protein, CIC family
MDASGASARPRPERERGLSTLFLVSLVVGAAAGFVGAAFRASLDAADRLRGILIAWSHGLSLGIVIVAGACALATAVAAWLVRRFAPPASGSGIPQVEAVLRDEAPPAPYALAPVKFAGGVLAIGAGLALGREGPTVQMGASIGVLIGRLFRLPRSDHRTLLAAGAGAGLAVAFNAPLAGAAFVLEELVQTFDRRITIAALTASATAIGVSRAMLGDALDFHAPSFADVSAAARPLFFLLGAVMGLAAIAYNRTLLGALAVCERLPFPVEARAAMIGAAVGALAWAYPSVVGGGDLITGNALMGAQSLTLVGLLFCVRFVLGAASYAAATPGGLFAPLLALGALLGLMFGLSCRWAFPGLEVPAESFALVGMAAFFTGVVRAPLTGMVLVSEMTGNVTLLLQMLGACAAAMLVPTLLGDPPIYDSLRKKLVRLSRAASAKSAKTSGTEDAQRDSGPI